MKKSATHLDRVRVRARGSARARVRGRVGVRVGVRGTHDPAVERVAARTEMPIEANIAWRDMGEM